MGAEEGALCVGGMVLAAEGWGLGRRLCVLGGADGVRLGVAVREGLPPVGVLLVSGVGDEVGNRVGVEVGTDVGWLVG